MNAAPALEVDRLLPPLGSPGCTVVNVVSLPTPWELIRKVLLLGSSDSWGLQARPVPSCPGWRELGNIPPLATQQAALRLERGQGNNTIIKVQRSNLVIAFMVMCSAFHCLHK